MKESKKPSQDTDSGEEVTPKVTGIGGIFFSSEDPTKTKEWYAENLGLEVDQWGALFEFRNATGQMKLITSSGVRPGWEVTFSVPRKKNS